MKVFDPLTQSGICSALQLHFALTSPHLLLLYYLISALKHDIGTGREGWDLFSWVQGSAKCSVFSLCLLELSQHYSTLKNGNFSLKCCKGLGQFLSVECAGKSLFKAICSEKWELIFWDH